MFIEGTLIGLILGKVRGGRLSNLKLLTIRAWPLAILAFMLQISPVFSDQLPWFAKLEPYAYPISLVILAFCTLLNIDKKGVWALLIGIVLNAAVVLANGNKMPVSFAGLELAGMDAWIEGIRSGRVPNYQSLSEVVNWTKYFGKYIVIPKPYPLSKVMSIGDIWMTLGLLLFIQGEMTRNRFHMRNRMIKFQYKGKI